MSVASVGSILSNSPTTTSATTTANPASSTVMGNFSTFLSILTTQLTHQDPTSATDTNQFTQELVQFAQVEQQLNTNSDLTQLINLQQSSGGLTSTLNYIGQYAEVNDPTDQMVLQNGSSEIGYQLGSVASATAIQVQDSTGTTVATLAGSGNAGMNYVTWNGKDSSGNQLPDGEYSFVLTAQNPDGTTQTPTSVTTIGKVTGVSTNTDGTFNLSIGNSLSVTSSQVKAVYNSSSLPASTLPSS